MFYKLSKNARNVLKYVCSCFCFIRLLSTGFNKGGLSKKASLRTFQ